MVMKELYRNTGAVSSGFSFDENLLAAFLQRMFEKKSHPDGIDPGMFREILRILNTAAKEGFGERSAVDPDMDFYDALLRNNAVFAAFKVHRMQNDMAAMLVDEKSALRTFEQWLNLVTPVADHQVRQWLETEYDTAVIRAHQAADWRQFEREKDVLPNLKWMPSTSLHPGADHRVFWGTVRPIDDPFWNRHRPGDRWNCKCGLSATDEPMTPVPEASPGDKPQKGLDNNPGKDAKLFSDTHPYQEEAYPGAKKAVDGLMKRMNDMIAEMSSNLTMEEKMAIAANNLEIEQALKITKGKPMTVDEADKQNANPNYKNQFILDPDGTYVDSHGNKYRKNPDYKPEDRMYEINCQTCAPAYALRLRGFNVVAKGNSSGSKLDYLSQGRSFYVWKNADGTPAEHVSINSWLASKGYSRMSPKRYMEFFNETCQKEGVYELVIGWKHGGGHATVLQKFADGELRYIEPQVDNSEGSGREWKNIEHLCKQGEEYSHDCRGIMRIDNKLFDVDFIDIFDIGGV